MLQAHGGIQRRHRKALKRTLKKKAQKRRARQGPSIFTRYSHGKPLDQASCSTGIFTPSATF